MNRMANALSTALHQRYFKQVRHLILNDGISVNYELPDGSYPLHVAAEKQDVETVKFLLSLRATPDFKNRHGETALMLAISNVLSLEHCISIMNVLINAHCAINLCDHQRRTALHIACSKGLPSVVKVLLDAGAKVNVRDRWGRTPLHMGLLNISHQHKSINSFYEVVKVLLVRNSEVNSKDKYQATPLFLTVSSGDHCLEIAKLLILYGAFPDQKSRHRLTPLMLAIMKGHQGMTKLLVQHNCSVNNTFMNTGKTCLYTACGKGFLDLAKFIVFSGFSIAQEKWLFMNNVLENFENLDSEVLEWLSTLRSKPLFLKELCRISIRKMMSCNIQRDIELIQYPNILKEYILLNNII